MPTKVCLCHWRLWRGTALTIWKTSSKFLLKSRANTTKNSHMPICLALDPPNISWLSLELQHLSTLDVLRKVWVFHSFPGFWLLILSNLHGDWCVLQGEWTISIGIHCLKRNHVVLPPIYRKNSSCLLIPITLHMARTINLRNSQQPFTNRKKSWQTQGHPIF